MTIDVTYDRLNPVLKQVYERGSEPAVAAGPGGRARGVRETGPRSDDDRSCPWLRFSVVPASNQRVSGCTSRCRTTPGATRSARPASTVPRLTVQCRHGNQY